MSYTVVARLLFALMPILPCAVLATESPTAPDVGVTTRVEPVIPAKPITTRAQLDTYLHDTPAASSPLSWLTSGAQRRFLDSIVFGQHGLGGMSLDDLGYELTREQAYTLLRLFSAHRIMRLPWTHAARHALPATTSRPARWSLLTTG